MEQIMRQNIDGVGGGGGGETSSSLLSPVTLEENIGGGGREAAGSAIDLIRKKPCRVVCVTMISLLMTTLIVLVNILVNLTKDILHNDKLWSAFQQYMDNKENSTCERSTQFSN
jgi:hypothetical protein